MNALLIVGLGATVSLMFIEHFRYTTLRPYAKLTAAAAFVGIGALGNHQELYQQLTMAGLIFGFIGDAALLSHEKKPFLIGIGAFLIGHGLYALAWIGSFHIEILSTLPSILFCLLAIVFTPYIVRFTNGFMKKAVVAYIIVITIMGITATSQTAVTADIRYVIGAALFALSDVSVALDRFTTLPRHHRWAGIPLYFGSQYILASTLVTS